MGSGSKALRNFIRQSLLEGHSFEWIKSKLLSQGYPSAVSDGIILDYRHRGRILKWLTFSFLSILLISSLYLSGTGILGMVTLNYVKSYVDSLDLTVETSSQFSWHPSTLGKLVSVAVTGNMIGDGNAKIYLEDLGKRYLIFDSTKKNFKVSDMSSSVLQERILHFDAACEESCVLDGLKNTDYNIVIEVLDSTIELQNIHFDMEVSKDLLDEPSFLIIPDQQMELGNTLQINLHSFFNTSISDVTFGYLTQQDFLNVSIIDGLASIQPLLTGTIPIYFTAKANDVPFISHLVNIQVTPGNSEEIIMVQGNAKTSSKSPSPSNTGLWIFFAFFGAIILAVFALIPARLYSLERISKKLDSLKKSHEFSQSLKDMKEAQSQLHRNISSEEKEKIVAEMQEKIHTLSSNLSTNQLQQRFTDLESQFNKRKANRQELYEELDAIYRKLARSSLSKKEKQLLYQRIRTCYNLL
jgi:hypothetical protein